MVTLTTNIIDVRASLRDLKGWHVPYATAIALTRTAYNAKELIKQRLPTIFNKPTPWVVNSLYVAKATSKNLVASLEYKLWASKGTATGKIMEHFVPAGTTERHSKRHEVLLRRAGVLKQNEYLAPANKAKLNAYGNLPSSKITKMLSEMKATFDTLQYASNRKKSKAKKATATTYFGTRRSGGLVIYERVGGKRIKPFMVGIGKPSYEPIFDMEGLTIYAYDRTFEYNLQAAITQVLSKVKK